MNKINTEVSIESPNDRPTVHLICNAHLDPVWQWRWEEGASEALATFRTAVDILGDHPGLIFCHNEAVLYQWVERLDPALFAEIRRLVRAGRWAVSGGWFLQPDTNLPGTESLIRQMAEGRRYFTEKFGARPRVAYNFDSFGHSAGLPQLLRLAGYEMYIHMRPQADELALPADLYRWRGADGTVIPAFRISVGLYHTERDNIEARLRAGVALALELGRDVPVFWGLGDHGGGATRADLRTIDAFIKDEGRVRVIHSTPDRFFDAVRGAAAVAPVFDGELERVFTGCYTSLSRLKRRAVRNLGTLVQSEAVASAAWWLRGGSFPAETLREAWRLHLFNDFHDVITGTCVEPAEADALDQYGRSEDIARGVRLGAVAALNPLRGISRTLVRGGIANSAIPVTVVNGVPAPGRVPVEFECMADYRPFWKGEWHLRLFRPDGREAPCQEEQPEALLPFNGWRRRLCFVDRLPGVGLARYEVRAFEGPAPATAAATGGHVPRGSGLPKRAAPSANVPILRIGRESGLVTSLKTAGGRECLAGPLLEPIVVEDTADSWGTGRWSYRKVVGSFKPVGPPRVVASGPVRTVTRTVFCFRKSRLVMDVLSYPDWPVLEFRLRVTWNEDRRRLKLSVPTRFRGASVLCEVPGAAVSRPADGEEHVHGRWLLIEGLAGGREAALGVVNSGQPGYDLSGGEVRLSVLRSAAYCHERGFSLADRGEEGTRPSRLGTFSPISAPAWKSSDIGVHDVRLLVAAGEPDDVRAILPSLADHLSAPPAAYAHLPFGGGKGGSEPKGKRGHVQRVHVPGALAITLLSLSPASVRVLACKPSWDSRALVIRVQEAVGKRTRASLTIALPIDEGVRTAGIYPQRHKRGHVQRVHVPLCLKAFEIKTVRVETDGTSREVSLIEEAPA